jgi:hypothetical protein
LSKVPEIVIGYISLELKETPERTISVIDMLLSRAKGLVEVTLLNWNA